jgi:hypothetical protein
VAVPVHLWAGSVLGAARGPGPLGRRSQAGKGARWCRVRGDLPAWRVTPPLHPVRRSQGRLAARGPGRRRRGMGRRGRCSGNAWRCLPAGAPCTRSAGTPGAPHFLELPPRSRFWVSARGIPRVGVSVCGGSVCPPVVVSLGWPWTDQPSLVDDDRRDALVALPSRRVRHCRPLLTQRLPTEYRGNYPVSQELQRITKAGYGAERRILRRPTLTTS